MSGLVSATLIGLDKGPCSKLSTFYVHRSGTGPRVGGGIFAGPGVPCGVLGSSGSMDDDPPPPSASPHPPKPSRLKRTLHTLRSPFRTGSPFHIGPFKRAGSTKSSVSDGEIARDERTMRKKSKKQRADAASAASHSTDSSPGVDKKKTLLKKMSTIGKRHVDSTPSTTDPEGDYEPEKAPKPQRESEADSEISNAENKSETTPKPDTEIKTANENKNESTESENKTETTKIDIKIQKSDFQNESIKSDPGIQESSSKFAEQKSSVSLPETSTLPEPTFSPIAVEHPVLMRAFTKEAWKRRSKTEIINKPVEEPSPESAERRHITLVAQASVALDEDDGDDDDDDDEDDAEEGEVHSLEAAIALARQRLAMAAHPPSPPRSHSQSRDNGETEEEGHADAMPAYGDLIEPEHKAGNDDDGPSHASASSERREHLYKILVIGELGTGKTSIIKRYVHQFFSQHYRATIGVDFALKVLNWDANTIIRLQLWDIAGQERFGNMTRVYYKEAVGAFIVFDVSRGATFDAVVKWKNDLDTKVQLPDGSPIPCILLANKCDQQKEGIVNSPGKMDEYCREKGFAGWFETSAKENINIEDAARSLVNKILLNDKLLQNNDKDGDKFGLEHKIANGENNREPSSSKSCSC